MAVALYSSVLAAFGVSDSTAEDDTFRNRLLFTSAMFVIHGFWVWGVGGVMPYFCYKRGWWAQWKIQPLKWPSRELTRRAIKHLLPETFVTNPLMSYFVMYPAFRRAGTLFSAETVPSALTMTWQIVVCFLITDATFYWAHRALHHRILYARIHKQHHEFKQTVGLSAVYSHPVESIVNALSTLVGPALLQVHFSTLLLFLFLRMWETVDAHCGYDLPFSPWNKIANIQGGADRHDFHHSHNVGNYGMLAHWDAWCGTDASYKAWKQKVQQSKATKSS